MHEENTHSVEVEECALVSPAVDRWMDRVTLAVMVFAVLYFGGHVVAWWAAGCSVGR